MKFRQTPSQTIGPFFAHGLTPEQYRYRFTSIAHPIIAGASATGEQILITGKVYDGAGNAVNDAMLEFWQCDAEGNYAEKEQNPDEKGFRGFGRVGTGTREDLSFEVNTIKPGSIDGQAPHINVIIFMRGALNHQYTRIYFSDEAALNETDRTLSLVPASRKQTLIAHRTEEQGRIIYTFDVQMQGEKETVFFDV